MDTRSNGAELTADDAGDVFVAHVFEKAKNQDLPLFGGQRVEAGMDMASVLGGKTGVAVVDQVIFDQGALHGAAFTECSPGPIASDAVKPCAKGRGIGQARQPPNDVQPDVLQ